MGCDESFPIVLISVLDNSLIQTVKQKMEENESDMYLSGITSKKDGAHPDACGRLLTTSPSVGKP